MCERMAVGQLADLAANSVQFTFSHEFIGRKNLCDVRVLRF